MDVASLGTSAGQAARDTAGGQGVGLEEMRGGRQEQDQPLIATALFASAMGDVVTAEQHVRAAQEQLRKALLASASAHRRAARLARWRADATAAEQHALWAKEDALSADCITIRST